MDNVHEPFPWGAFWIGAAVGAFIVIALLGAASSGWFSRTDRDDPDALTLAVAAKSTAFAEDTSLACARSLSATVDELASTRGALDRCVGNLEACVALAQDQQTLLDLWHLRPERLAHYDNPNDCPKFYLNLLMDVRYCYDNVGAPLGGDAYLEGCIYAVLANRSWGWPRPTVMP